MNDDDDDERSHTKRGYQETNPLFRVVVFCLSLSLSNFLFLLFFATPVRRKRPPKYDDRSTVFFFFFFCLLISPPFTNVICLDHLPQTFGEVNPLTPTATTVWASGNDREFERGRGSDVDGTATHPTHKGGEEMMMMPLARKTMVALFVSIHGAHFCCFPHQSLEKHIPKYSYGSYSYTVQGYYHYAMAILVHIHIYEYTHRQRKRLSASTLSIYIYIWIGYHIHYTRLPYRSRKSCGVLHIDVITHSSVTIDPTILWFAKDEMEIPSTSYVWKRLHLHTKESFMYKRQRPTRVRVEHLSYRYI